MAWTNPRTWNIGETVTKAMLDEQIRDNGRVLQGGTARQVLRMNAGATAPEYVGAIACRINRSTAQTIAHDTDTAVSFDTEVLDTDGFWVVGSPTLITFPYDGKYMVGGSAGFDANATGYRGLYLTHSTLGRVVGSYSNAGTWVELAVATLISVSAGQTMTMKVYQNSTGNLNLFNSPRPTVWATFLGP